MPLIPFQAFALKADLARYCLLYVYGGLYSDLSNRFLARWRIGADKAIACFREHKPLHGAVWMNQNTIIYALPGQPEIRLAIDLVLENVRTREYGISSLAPSGPVLFGCGCRHRPSRLLSHRRIWSTSRLKVGSIAPVMSMVMGLWLQLVFREVVASQPKLTAWHECLW
jgi:hypothetical protein